jgi:hypothetical protein
MDPFAGSNDHWVDTSQMYKNKDAIEKHDVIIRRLAGIISNLIDRVQVLEKDLQKTKAPSEHTHIHPDEA